MNKLDIEKILKKAVSTGASFADVFYEDSISKDMLYTEDRVDQVTTKFSKGIGIRISQDENTVYAYTNDLDNKNIDNLLDRLIVRFSEEEKAEKFTLKEINKKSWDKSFDDFSNQDKKELCKNIYDYIKKLDDRIVNINVMLMQDYRKTKVGNTFNKLVYDNHLYNRLFITVIARDEEKTGRHSVSYANSDNLDIFDFDKIKNDLKDLVDVAIKKLDAVDCPSGELPVVIENGFGAVIFHESCGHALEATDVVKNTSVLSNMIGKKIASDKVTLIDDGTIPNLFGTSNYDDEGNETRKNVLIKDGILQNYLVDYLNSIKMNHPFTGSARRENYKYAPMSRMNNTYLEKGHDKVEDMIKSIKFGLYAKKIGGGQVDTYTGDFNFGVNEAYIIRDGKICEIVKGASLIGNTLDILKKVEMVSDNLEYGEGLCGHLSGMVRVTAGQPTIKVSSILVGGSK